eukprot:1515119-Pyramimonas_sp.AAC.1
MRCATQSIARERARMRDEAATAARGSPSARIFFPCLGMTKAIVDGPSFEDRRGSRAPTSPASDRPRQSHQTTFRGRRELGEVLLQWRADGRGRLAVG